MSVTVYLPPNLLGLKMSLWTVAIAMRLQYIGSYGKLCCFLHLADMAGLETREAPLTLRKL